MNLINELQQWQKDLEELSVKKGRAEGKLEQAMSDLDKQGFKTVDEGQKELEELKEKKRKAEEEARELLDNLKEKYKNHIE